MILSQRHKSPVRRISYWLATFIALAFATSCTDPAVESSRDGSVQEAFAAPELRQLDIDNLFLMGKVWGYLKYHHPRVSAGCFDWDAQLVEMIPRTTEWHTRQSAQEALIGWISSVSSLQTECTPSDAAPVYIPADTGWISDDNLVSTELRRMLMGLDAGAASGSTQHYVSLAPGIGNPQFSNEASYEEMELPDWRYRLLALFRYWNIIEYWFPYRDLIPGDWDDTLRDFIPRLATADDGRRYVLELMALITRIEDGHANLWSAIEQRPPAGDLDVPAHIRWVEESAIVWRGSEIAESTGLLFGDVILAVDGSPVEQLFETWSPYYGASNQESRHRELARSLLRGATDKVQVRVDRAGEKIELELRRESVDRSRPSHDRDGDTFQQIGEDIAYVKLSSISYNDIPEYIERTIDLKGLVIDIRNYPSEFVVFALGQYLVEEITPFARFTNGDLTSPGTFRWTDPVELMPETPFLDRPVVILVDEYSISQSEYTAMAFRSAPNSIVIGSRTAGADGNISSIPLPGGHRTVITGIGVFYPDKSPTQQIGITPDISVSPTISGIRSGRDEVLEKAVLEILNDDISQDELRKITRIPHAPLSED